MTQHRGQPPGRPGGLAVVAIIALQLLSGCAIANGGSGSLPSTSVARQAVSPAANQLTAGAVTTAPRTTAAAASVRPTTPTSILGTGTESTVWIPAGDHRVPGTLAVGDPTAAAQPVVVMLPGDLGSRDGNGDMFREEAAELATHGIASLRIEFAGVGDSEEPDLALDYPSMVADATAAIKFLAADPRFDPTRIALLGMSRGGSIAATLAGTLPEVAALAEWSGAVYNGYDEDPADHDAARADGYATVGQGFRLSLNWFDTVERAHPLDDVANYTGPVLAVVGSADGTVPPGVSTVFLQTVASTDKTLHTIDGADHGFDATTSDQSHADEAMAVTTDWLTARLRP